MKNSSSQLNWRSRRGFQQQNDFRHILERMFRNLGVTSFHNFAMIGYALKEIFISFYSAASHCFWQNETAQPYISHEVHVDPIDEFESEPLLHLSKWAGSQLSFSSTICPTSITFQRYLDYPQSSRRSRLCSRSSFLQSWNWWIDTTISISDSPVPGMVANAYSDVLSMPTYPQIMSLEFE